jgi:hypothetical protein
VRAGAGEGGVDGEEDDDGEEGCEGELRGGGTRLLGMVVVVAPSARELLGGWWLPGVPSGEEGDRPVGRREVRRHWRAL